MYPYVNIHIFHHFVDINYMNFNILNELPSYSLASRDAPIPEKRPIPILIFSSYICKLLDSISAFHHEYNAFLMNMNVNRKAEWFVNSLWKLYDQHCPKRTKTVSYKNFVKPWITNEIKTLLYLKPINVEGLISKCTIVTKIVFPKY